MNEKIICNNCQSEIDADYFICPHCNTRQICFDEEEKTFYRILDHNQHKPLSISERDFIILRSMSKEAELRWNSKVNTIIRPIKQDLEMLSRYSDHHSMPHMYLAEAAKQVLDGGEAIKFEDEKVARKKWIFNNDKTEFDFDADELKDLYNDVITLQSNVRPKFELLSLLSKIKENYDNRSKPKVKKEVISSSMARELGLHKKASGSC